jgi:hypothetical protein
VKFYQLGSGRPYFSQNSPMTLLTQVAIPGPAVLPPSMIVLGMNDERSGVLRVCWLMLGCVDVPDSVGEWKKSASPTGRKGGSRWPI